MNLSISRIETWIFIIALSILLTSLLMILYQVYFSSTPWKYEIINMLINEPFINNHVNNKLVIYPVYSGSNPVKLSRKNECRIAIIVADSNLRDNVQTEMDKLVRSFGNNPILGNGYVIKFDKLVYCLEETEFQNESGKYRNPYGETEECVHFITQDKHIKVFGLINYDLGFNSGLNYNGCRIVRNIKNFIGIDSNYNCD